MTKNDETIQMALIAIQGKVQRPMSNDDFARELKALVPDCEDPVILAAAKDGPADLYKLGIFVRMPKKLPDAVTGKLVLHHGLPQFCPGGVLFTEQFEAELEEKFEMLAALFASATELMLYRHVKDLKLQINGEDVSIDTLKINCEMLREANKITLVRLRKEYRTLLTPVAKNVMIDQTDLVAEEPKENE